MVQRSRCRRLVTLSATAAALAWAFSATPVLASGGGHTPEARVVAAHHCHPQHNHDRGDDRRHDCGDQRSGHSGGEPKGSGGGGKGSGGGTAVATPVAGGGGALLPAIPAVVPNPSSGQAQPSGPAGPATPSAPALAQVITLAGAPVTSTRAADSALSPGGLGAMAPLGGILYHGLNITSLLLMVNLLLALGMTAVLRLRGRMGVAHPA